MADRPRPLAQGFTLLEAIVALVLIAGAGMALFAWINSNLQALERVRDANARAEATSNALEFMRAVNPMARPEGKAQLGSGELSWSATPVAPEIDRLASRYSYGLYDTRLLLRKSDGAAWFELQVRQVGYRKIRSMSPD